jgi:hypothetical protein
VTLRLLTAFGVYALAGWLSFFAAIFGEPTALWLWRDLLGVLH